MTQDDDDDEMTPEQVAADLIERVTTQMFSTVWLWTRDAVPGDVPVDEIVGRISEVFTVERYWAWRAAYDAERAAKDEERTRHDKDVVRKRGDLGATWHRKLTERSTACGKPIPDDPETGRIGDEHVIRSFLCGSCLRLPKNLYSMRVKRQRYEH